MSEISIQEQALEAAIEEIKTIGDNPEFAYAMALGMAMGLETVGLISRYEAAHWIWKAFKVKLARQETHQRSEG